jgi:hypothetical protein
MKFTIIILSLIISSKILAHGDHSEPGAIPPAPHGGTVEEAKHAHDKHKHDHKEASKKEIFFEGVFKAKTIKIYPLVLDPNGHKAFLEQDTSNFSKVSVVLKDPRKNKEYQAKLISKKKFWEISLSDIRGRRFILKITAYFEGAKYVTDVQVERK